MVRIWRFSRQKRCLKSDTRMTKSVTLTAHPGLQGLQGAVDVLTENIGRLGGNLAQGFQPVSYTHLTLPTTHDV